MTERDAYIALNMMEKVGPVGVRSLAAALGSVADIMQAPCDALMSARGVGPELSKAIVTQRERVDPGAEEEKAAQIGARLVTPIDEQYPRSLLEIHDPPLALYVRGELRHRDRHAVAVVGTRRPTHYGRDTAECISREVARAGFTIVSGLAEGIDTCAHKGALRGEGRTLAVLGSPLDPVYPRSNAALAEEISGHGAVMSELPFGRKPDKTTFPMRNRIVSGLSMGVLVVEAGARSGALITVRQALEQGRTVFAVPGRIDSHASQGCLSLLKDGATLVRGAEDVLAEFDMLIGPVQRAAIGRGESGPVLTSDEDTLVKTLADGDQDVDSLIRASGLATAAVNSLLIGLEMKKVVRMLPGRRVELARAQAAGR